MPELIDRQAALKKMCETCGYCERFEKAMRLTHPDFVSDKCNNYKFIAEQPTIELETRDIDRAKIMRLCNEIEDICAESYARCHMNLADCKAIMDKINEIGKELTGDADD